MKRPKWPIALIMAVLALPCAALPQDAPQSYGPNITLELAKRIAAGAEAEALKNKWNVFIAIVDANANLVLVHRIDDAQLGSLNVAQKKAYTAAAFRRSTKVFEDGVAAGGAGLRVLSNDQIMPIEGGLPIVLNGKVVGAIGVSGVTPQQDGIVAKAGINSLEKK